MRNGQGGCLLGDPLPNLDPVLHHHHHLPDLLANAEQGGIVAAAGETKQRFQDRRFPRAVPPLNDGQRTGGELRLFDPEHVVNPDHGHEHRSALLAEEGVGLRGLHLVRG